MYNTDMLYSLIVDNLKEVVDIDDYDLKEIDDYEWDLNEYECDIRDTILCNNDFDWFGEDGRKILAEAAGEYEGHTYETLAKALTDEDFAIEIIFKARFDEAVEDMLELFTMSHKTSE